MNNKFDKFIWKEGDIKLGDCISCEHKYQTGAFCDAFPGGIPEEINTGEVSHKKSYPGDNGIKYKAIE